MEIIDNLEDEAAEVQKPEGMPPLRGSQSRRKIFPWKIPW